MCVLSACAAAITFRLPSRSPAPRPCTIPPAAVPEVVGAEEAARNPSCPKDGPMPLNPDAVSRIHYYGGTLLGSDRGGDDVETALAFVRHFGINQLYVIGAWVAVRCGARRIEPASRPPGRRSHAVLRCAGHERRPIDRPLPHTCSFSVCLTLCRRRRNAPRRARHLQGRARGGAAAVGLRRAQDHRQRRRESFFAHIRILAPEFRRRACNLRAGTCRGSPHRAAVRRAASLRPARAPF